MTDQEIFRRYSVSYFWRPIPTDVLPPGWKARARAAFEADPAGCLLENVTESQAALRATTARLHEARLDGLFDKERYRAVGEDDIDRWVACMDTVRGDYQRARSDLEHWQRLARRAREGGVRFKVPRSLRELADSKSMPTPEEDAETNRQKREAAERLAQWSAAQKTGERIPGEEDEELAP